MKHSAKTLISIITASVLLTASLCGCSGSEVAEATQTIASVQENPAQDTQQTAPAERPEGMEAPEMQIVEISEEDVATLVQAGLDAVTEESDQWSIYAITDTEALMEFSPNMDGREKPEGGMSEEREPPEGEAGEIPEGTMPEWDGENPSENMEGTFPESGEFPNEGGGRQFGNRGGGMGSAMIVISSTETAQISTEDIVTAIQEAAEILGYSAFSMEVTEEQAADIDTEEGYAPTLIIMISANNMGREQTQEAAD